MSEDEVSSASDLVRQAAAELYGGSAAGFVARRAALVKAARASRDRQAAAEIAALRKPSLAAAALNAVVRERPEVVDRLRHLGARLRHAQSTLDSQGLQALRPERDEVLASLLAAAGGASGAGGLTPAVEAEVRETAIAALADLSAEEVAWSGALTRTLSYSGFGEVDVADAVAQTSTGVRLARIAGGAQAGDTTESAAEEGQPEPASDATGGGKPEPDSDEAEAAAGSAARDRERAERIGAAEQAVAAAERELGAILAEVEQARSRSELTANRVVKLSADLDQARAEQQSAADALSKASAARKTAHRALTAAEDAIDELREI